MTEQYVEVEDALVLQEYEPTTSDEELGKQILARFAAGEKAKVRSDDMFLAAGIFLIAAKKRVNNFEAFLTEHCNGLSHSRAYELIAIADGSTTTEEVRAKANVRKKRHREKKKGAVSVPERTRKPDQKVSTKKVTKGTSSDKAFAEFKYAVDNYIPKMNAETKKKALDYVIKKTRS